MFYIYFKICSRIPKCLGSNISFRAEQARFHLNSPHTFADFYTCALLLEADTHYFLPGAQHPQFSKADVERRALERPIGLSDHNHVNAAWESGLIDPFIELPYCHQHLACQLPHIVHGVHLSAKIAFVNLHFTFQPLILSGLTAE